jgi:hypothetical protein
MEDRETIAGKHMRHGGKGRGEDRKRRGGVVEFDWPIYEPDASRGVGLRRGASGRAPPSSSCHLPRPRGGGGVIEFSRRFPPTRPIGRWGAIPVIPGVWANSTSEATRSRDDDTRHSTVARTRPVGGRGGGLTMF